MKHFVIILLKTDQLSGWQKTNVPVNTIKVMLRLCLCSFGDFPTWDKCQTLALLCASSTNRSKISPFFKACPYKYGYSLNLWTYETLNLKTCRVGRLLCCINIKSQVKNMLCLHLFVAEIHPDSCNIIWMSNFLRKAGRHSNDIATV